MNAEIILNLIQTAVLVLVLSWTVRLLVSGKREVRTAFFAFAMTSALLSNLYWLAFDILRSEETMPFAANEIGEWAMFLLLGAAINEVTAYSFAKKEVAFAVLFTAANAGLWIAWSGEWIQDILTGVTFGYFLCSLVSKIKQNEAFHVLERRLLFISCFVLIAVQTAIFFVPDPLKNPLDLFCYWLLFAVAALLLIRAFMTLVRGGAKAAVPCVFAAFAWATITMYMSSGVFYIAAMLMSTLCLPMMLLALKKEAKSV